MRMAIEYEAPGLIKQSRAAIIEQIHDPYTAINTHQFAIDIGDGELKEACLKFICAYVISFFLEQTGNQRNTIVF